MTSLPTLNNNMTNNIKTNEEQMEARLKDHKMIDDFYG